MDITIVNKAREDKTLFKDLTPGNIFCYVRERGITPHMKTKPFINGETLKPCNSIRLKDGALLFFEDTFEVEVLDANLLIEK